MWTPDVCGVDVRCLDFALEPFGGGLVLTGERLGRAGMGVACVWLLACLSDLHDIGARRGVRNLSRGCSETKRLYIESAELREKKSLYIYS